jgi:hypothetical protein
MIGHDMTIPFYCFPMGFLCLCSFTGGSSELFPYVFSHHHVVAWRQIACGSPGEFVGFL